MQSFHLDVEGIKMTQTKGETRSVEVPKDTNIFDMQEYLKSIGRGFFNGMISTTLTFSIADKPLYYAQRVEGYGTYSSDAIAAFRKGHYKEAWNKSNYVHAYREYWKQPGKGLPIAYFNSMIKNALLFPIVVFYEKALTNAFPDTNIAQNYAGFCAGTTAVYLTSPISVIKARLYGNETFAGFWKRLSFNSKIETQTQDLLKAEETKISYHRLMAGVNATAIRDGIYFGVYCALVDKITVLVGKENYLAASIIAGLIGTIPSNIFSIIALNQKVSDVPKSIFTTGKEIYTKRGIPGFYPLLTLTALGMIGRSAALGISNKYYNEHYDDWTARFEDNAEVEEVPGTPTVST